MAPISLIIPDSGHITVAPTGTQAELTINSGDSRSTIYLNKTELHMLAALLNRIGNEVP
jgi:hypothetical protein